MADRFIRFCIDKFKLLLMAARIGETRKRPEIPMETIILLMVFSLAFGCKSYHQIDFLARRPAVRRLLGRNRDTAASDTTLQRVLPTIDLDELREELQKNYIAKRQSCATFTLKSGRRVRIAVVDGYETGSGMASCLLTLTDRGVAFIDAEPYEKEGKELPSSTVLIQRAAERHGEGFVDIVLQDPLYVSAPYWTACRKKKIHALVKGDGSKKEDLLVLQEARRLCAIETTSNDIERAEGTDVERKVTYRVRAVHGLTHADYEGTVKVALVEETCLKPRGGKQAKRPNVSSFWVIATDESLTAEEMRELGHLRWTIENQGFRSLNAHLGSKGTWTRGKLKKKTFPVLFLLMLVAFNLVNDFEAGINEDDIRRDLKQSSKARVHAVTLRLIADRIVATLKEDAAPLVSNG